MALPGASGDHPFIKRLILEELSGKLEPIESIAERLTRRGIWLSDDGDRNSLGTVLWDLVTDGLLAGYLLHVDSPCLTAVDPCSDSIQNCWFSVTESGDAYVREIIDGRN
jgi:hypothetical protein